MGAPYDLTGAYAIIDGDLSKGAQIRRGRDQRDRQTAGRELKLEVRDIKNNTDGTDAASKELVDLGVTSAVGFGDSVTSCAVARSSKQHRSQS